MTLPSWIEAIAKEHGASRADYLPKVVQALSIAWTALAYTKINWIEKEKRGNMSKREVVNDAMRQIEELGNESETKGDLN